MCPEIESENTETTFSSRVVEDGKKDLNVTGNNSHHAFDCEGILYSIPLDNDELDDKKIDYYDSLINI